ncbi:MAG: hypothetical protein HY055_13665 [Magnetospirillum sp.]|nr:hypothetical protein [Magnetospirillum sp.]MBI3707999.1 hypothetical protein [Pseudomonadota bacterium]
MNDYTFFSAILRFVAGKTENSDQATADPRTRAMMSTLRAIADAAETSDGFEVAGDALELTARALAGFAGFLQKSILPEAVAHGNQTGERQIRWSVDTAMDAVNTLLARAALQEGQPVRVTLPPPP